MNLILMGLRGSGKTSVGRLLAARLHRPLVDLDDVTPKLLGAPTVAAAWARFGQPKFREAESRALAGVLENDNQVIALGGGTPLAPGAADLLRAERDARRAFIVYLTADPDVLRDRLGVADISNRPSLTGADPLAEIEVVHRARDPVYRELASATIPSAGRDIATVADDAARAAGL